MPKCSALGARPWSLIHCAYCKCAMGGPQFLWWNILCWACKPKSPNQRHSKLVQLLVMQAARVKSNQFLFLNCSQAGYFEWHPFSIAAAYPSQDGLTQDVLVHVKAYGAWSRKLVTLLADQGSIVVRVGGPYGAASKPEWSHYDQLIMIAGGIGVRHCSQFNVPCDSLLTWQNHCVQELKGHWPVMLSSRNLLNQVWFDFAASICG